MLFNAMTLTVIKRCLFVCLYAHSSVKICKVCSETLQTLHIYQMLEIIISTLLEFTLLNTRDKDKMMF